MAEAAEVAEVAREEVATAVVRATAGRVAAATEVVATVAEAMGEGGSEN